MEPKRPKLDPEIVNEINGDACSITDLPNETIEKIFSYLTQNQLGQIARVCKRFNVLTKSPVFWKKVNVKLFRSSDSEEDSQSFKSFIDGLPSCVTFIKLDFSGRAGRDNLNFEKLCMILHNFPNVEVLILTRCSISTGLREVINFCTQFSQNLRKLVFHNCRFRSYSVTEKLKDNSNIEVLDIFRTVFSYSNEIEFSKLLSLKELRLAGTYVDDDCFVGHASFLNQLQVLDVGGTNVTARTFSMIQRHGQNLKELYLCNLRLEDHDLNFNPVFPHLKTICLRRTSVTCEGLVSLVRSCPSLVSVYVDENVAEDFAEHPFVVANRCKSGIAKSIRYDHNHSVDYSHR